jgi:hypothetical protein
MALVCALTSTLAPQSRRQIPTGAIGSHLYVPLQKHACFGVSSIPRSEKGVESRIRDTQVRWWQSLNRRHETSVSNRSIVLPLWEKTHRIVHSVIAKEIAVCVEIFTSLCNSNEVIPAREKTVDRALCDMPLVGGASNEPFTPGLKLLEDTEMVDSFASCLKLGLNFPLLKGAIRFIVGKPMNRKRIVIQGIATSEK